uniref:Long chain base biosynthesis protein 1 n=1 Tax=Tanacetum cinerariifolium TaxID=118510 RepID=A0A6L2JD45_TANCI|nr:long chain base biosynthesis protein 1 [Tanacetum cinerariifolium]
MEITDKNKGCMELLQQLTICDLVSEKVFQKPFEEFKAHGDDHIICVIEDVSRSKIVATGSVFIENKFVRSCGKAGHIKDVVVDSSSRGMQLGKKAIGFLAEHARSMGCYKVSAAVCISTYLVDYHMLLNRSLELSNNIATTFMSSMKNASDWVTFPYDARFARAVVFGVPIGGHLFMEGLLLVVILFLLSQKSYKPPKRLLTSKEIDELCDEWVPESLIPPIEAEMEKEPPELESAAGPHTIIDGKDVVNFALAIYLGLMGHEKLLESCTTALGKYGVGLCGQFYGTIARIAKRSRYCRLSTLEKVKQDNKRAKKLRRYIVVESVYQNSSQIAPLDEIIRVKKKYRFRVLLDESNSFGVLGESGRGQTEHYKVPIDKVDIITAAMGHVLASEGGFCTGSNRVIDHQVLKEQIVFVVTSKR